MKFVSISCFLAALGLGMAGLALVQDCKIGPGFGIWGLALMFTFVSAGTWK